MPKVKVKVRDGVAGEVEEGEALARDEEGGVRGRGREVVGGEVKSLQGALGVGVGVGVGKLQGVALEEHVAEGGKRSQVAQVEAAAEASVGQIQGNDFTIGRARNASP